MRYKPSLGQEYWMVMDANLVDMYIWEDSPFDQHMLSLGNLFSTKEAAERYQSRIILVVEMYDFADLHNALCKTEPEIWQIYYNEEDHSWNYYQTDFYPNMPVFYSEQIIQLALAHFADRLHLFLTHP